MDIMEIWLILIIGLAGLWLILWLIYSLIVAIANSQNEKALNEYYAYELTEGDRNSMIIDLVFDYRMSFDDRCREENIHFRTKKEHDDEEENQCEEYEQSLKNMSDDALKYAYRWYLIKKEIHESIR